MKTHHMERKGTEFQIKHAANSFCLAQVTEHPEVNLSSIYPAAPVKEEKQWKSRSVDFYRSF